MFVSINLSTGQNSGGSEAAAASKHASRVRVRQDSTTRKYPDDGVQLRKCPLRQDTTTRKSFVGGGSGDEVPARKAPVRQESPTTGKSLDCDAGGDEVPLKKGPLRQSSTTGSSFDAPNVKKLAYGGKGNVVQKREIIAISVIGESICD